MSRTSVGGWSQARYRRHIENHHLHHAKEVVRALNRAVRGDRIEKIVLAGDEVIVPVLREQTTTAGPTIHGSWRTVAKPHQPAFPAEVLGCDHDGYVAPAAENAGKTELG